MAKQKTKRKRRVMRDYVWLLIGAMRKVEGLGICRIDFDMPTEDEHAAIRELVGVLQFAAKGYPEERPHPRLSDEIARLLQIARRQDKRRALTPPKHARKR